MAIRLIDVGKVSSIRSQTLYHGLGYTFSDETPNTIVFAIPKDPYMCIGFFQDAEQELDISYCKENNLPIIRRETGGGAVYIDENQLFVQWIFRSGDMPARIDERFEFFVQPLIETYKEIGIDAYYYPINDVHVAGKKIVGTGAGGIGEAEVVTGNFLFDFNYDVMSKALKFPRQKLREEFDQGIKKYVTTIHRETHEYINIYSIKHIYLSKVGELLNQQIERGSLEDVELAKIEELDEKMLSDSWLYQSTKPASKNRMVKIHAGVWIGELIHCSKEGTVQIEVKLMDDKIEKLELSGKFDQAPDFELDELRDSLIGVELNNIKNRVTRFFEPANYKNSGLKMGDWITAFSEIKKMRTGIS